jgi:hypothetical protein
MFFLLYLKNPINIFVHIIRGFDLYTLSECKEVDIVEPHTAVAKSSIAFPAMRASS